MLLSIQLLSNVRRACVTALFFLFACVSTVSAQQTKITIQVAPASASVLIEGERAAAKVWSFRDSYAGVVGLGSRIERLTLFDEAGAEVAARKIAAGQFESSKPAAKFRYEVNLAPPAQAADAARVSWLTAERGVLMLADLLPIDSDGNSLRTAVVKFKPANPLTIYANEEANSRGEFIFSDTEKAVFIVGIHLRASRTAIANMELRLIMDGAWAFTDEDVSKMATQILRAHHDVFKAMPARQVTLSMLPFPETVATNRWSAETRGATVLLLMGKQPTMNGALAQLSVPLTHELFHLWIPNALALAGDYEWFYEGFTIYQAARTAVRLDLLTFPEFLNAIARAYDAYLSAADRDKLSLIEASQTRWTGGESLVYQKAMLVAFLYDLKIRSQSHGKRSLDDLYRALFHQYGATGAARRPNSGNEVLIEALNSALGTNSFAEAFIKRASVIDLAKELAPFGPRLEKFGTRSRVVVDSQLSRQQRDLLRELGYNDYRR